jgi:patatin-like phospholipase/acyl hydrolase
MNVLALDGGGSKGVYTLGILKELELMIGEPLYKKFDFIYGTSTGSILAALIGLGYSTKEIELLYFDMIPKIMRRSTASAKTKELRRCLEETFKNNDFTEFKTGIGIVATNYENERPLIFKADINQAYKLKHSFIPGFGCSIYEAVLASCAAYPIFEKVILETKNQGSILSIDGGFIANNPILFAIADAINALNVPIQEVKFLSLGTGNFIETSIGVKSKIYRSLKMVQLFEKILKSNANTIEILARLLFKDISLLRINESFNQPEYGTNMVESDLVKLRLLQRLGRDSFGKFENELKLFFK